MKKTGSAIKNLLFMYKQIYTISPSRIWLVFILCIVELISTVVDLYFLKFIIDGLYRGYEIHYFIMVILVKLFALLIYQLCLNIFNNYFYRKSDEKIKRELAMKLFSKARLVHLSKIENPAFYDEYQKALNEVTERASELLGYLHNCISIILNLITLSTIIITMQPILIIIAILGMAITMRANFVNTKRCYDMDMSLVEVNRKIDYVKRIFYQPAYSKDIRRTKLPELLENTYDEALNKKMDLIHKHWPPIIAIAISGSWIYNVINIGGSYLYLVIMALKGIISIGDITTLTNTTNQLSNTLLNISYILPQGLQHSLYIQNYINMVNKLDKSDIYISEDKLELSQFENFSLKAISFKYQGRNFCAINNLDLIIRKGEHIAIVGDNGAGKSTLVKLLTGLYIPTDGEICINGHLYNECSFDSLCSLVSVVDQDFQHYAFPIIDNIALQTDLSNIDEEKIENVLKKVGMYEEVVNCSEGINTIYSHEFNDKGVDFSGGQLQRLAITRALYADSEVIIMDEPSSALDPISEQKMFDMIYEVCKNKTLIVISHRLSCVKDMDRILVMENGQIVEEGNHQKLMKQKGKYHEMFTIQGKRYGIQEEK